MVEARTIISDSSPLSASDDGEKIVDGLATGISTGRGGTEHGHSLTTCASASERSARTILSSVDTTHDRENDSDSGDRDGCGDTPSSLSFLPSMLESSVLETTSLFYEGADTSAPLSDALGTQSNSEHAASSSAHGTTSENSFLSLSSLSHSTFMTARDASLTEWERAAQAPNCAGVRCTAGARDSNRDELLLQSSQISSSSASSSASTTSICSSPQLSPDSFAIIGRSLMLSYLSLPSLGEDKSTGSSSSHTREAESILNVVKSEERGIDCGWWSRFKTEEDWEVFRRDANAYVDAMLLAETKTVDPNGNTGGNAFLSEEKCLEKDTKSGKQCCGALEVLSAQKRQHWLQYYLLRLFGPREEENGASKDISGCTAEEVAALLQKTADVQKCLKRLPPSPPDLPAYTTAEGPPLFSTLSVSSLEAAKYGNVMDTTHGDESNRTNTHTLLFPLTQSFASSPLKPSRSESVCIPSHLACHLCQDLLVGVTLIDCTSCRNSVNSGGSFAFCRLCIEDKHRGNDDGLLSCPICTTTTHLCHPVPCHALDVVISNAMLSPSFPSLFLETSQDGSVSGNLSKRIPHHILKAKYRARLEAWRVIVTLRRDALHSELRHLKEQVLAAMISAEELFYLKKRRVANSNDFDGIDMGVIDGDGYVMVLDSQSPEWMEDETPSWFLRQRQYGLTLRDVATAVLATATAGVGIIFTLQA